jgi:hypothetical protein
LDRRGQMQERHVLADALLAKHDPAGPTPRGPLPRWIEPTRPTYGECSNLRYAPEAGLYWSLDFNVDPMTAVIAQHLKGRLHVLEEIFLRNANTPQMCERFEQRVAPYVQAYRAANGGQALPVIVNGDSTAKSRSTASKTDYELITEYFRSRGQLQIRMDYPSKNPPVKDRVNSVNALLKNANGEIRTSIHPDCKELITDF